MEDRLPKIYEWQQTGRRKRGQPNITWTKGILKTMRERGLQEGDWEDREDVAHGYKFLIWVQEDIVKPVNK